MPEGTYSASLYCGYESEYETHHGYWEKNGNDIFLTSVNQPSVSGIDSVLEHEDANAKDSVRVKVWLYDTVSNTYTLDYPVGSLGTIDFSGLDTQHILGENPVFTILWPKNERNFFLINDVEGFYKPYQIKNIKSDYIEVYFRMKSGYKPDLNEFFYKEKFELSFFKNKLKRNKYSIFRSRCHILN